MINRQNKSKHGFTGMISMVLVMLFALSAILTGCKAKTEEAAAGGTKVYSSSDGWELEYETANVKVTEENGTARFTCTLGDNGETYFEISYVPGKLPKEVLYEKVADIDDSRVYRGEGRFGGLKDDWSHTYLVYPEVEGDPTHQYSGIEHNGGTLLVHSTYKTGVDDDNIEVINDTMSETLCKLKFTNHEPQQEFSYVPGTYEYTYTEEIEGKTETFADKIVLNADHTGTFSAQDDVPLLWSSWELIINNDAERYEYTVEGDTLMVKVGDEWLSFNRVNK